LFTTNAVAKSCGAQQVPKALFVRVNRTTAFSGFLGRLSRWNIVGKSQLRPPRLDAFEGNIAIQMFVVVRIAEALQTVYAG